MSIHPMPSHLQSIATQQPAAWRNDRDRAHDRSQRPAGRDTSVLRNLDLVFPPSGRCRHERFLPRMRRRTHTAVRELGRTFQHLCFGSVRHRTSGGRAAGRVEASWGDDAHGASPAPVDGGAMEQKIDQLSQVIRSLESSVAELKVGGRAISGAGSNGSHRGGAHRGATGARRRSEKQDSVLREIFETNLALRQVEGDASEAKLERFAQPAPA